MGILKLNDDKQTPKLNNKEEPYYSTIICNQSKGSSPKSKVNKIILCIIMCFYLMFKKGPEKSGPFFNHKD